MPTKPADDLTSVLDQIEVPECCYYRAEGRYTAIGKHLLREESRVAQYEPRIYPQGSFRLGTAIKPLGDAELYDVDLVCQMRNLEKTAMTQQRLRKLVGLELEDYIKQHSIKEPLEERKRCWTLHYAGEPTFHIDILPSVPEDLATVVQITQEGNVHPELARFAIGITDNTHPMYRTVASDWPSSNPDGYGMWFAERMIPTESFREAKDIAALPKFTNKLPLQRVVQLLKRHYRTFFRDNDRYAPIAMLVTTLAARLYAGQASIEAAVEGIVPHLRGMVDESDPVVSNPVNHNENFADKWQDDPTYWVAFQRWCGRLEQDMAFLLTGSRTLREATADKAFHLRADQGNRGFPAVVISPTPVAQPSGQKPWGFRI
jgi:hypothetical protein